MKYDHRDISELTNDELLAAYWDMLNSLEKREEAAKHRKFKSMSLPPPNPESLKLKDALKAELENRKIGTN